MKAANFEPPVLCLTPEQAAAACQVSRDQIDVWTHRPGFPVIRDGRVVRIPLDQLRTWLASESLITNGPPVGPGELTRPSLMTNRRHRGA